MSKQESKTFEGLTLKVICQVVDVTYHGVEVSSSKGNGILGSMINPIINLGKAREDNSSKATTRSAEIERIPMSDLTKADTAYVGKVRAHLIAEHGAVNAKVNQFHRELNSLKEELLGGRTSNSVNQSELDKVRESMTAFNVGKVLKVKLQARIFSKEIIPGYNKVKTGGSSKVNVLYTFYLPYGEEDVDDLDDIAEAIAEEFRGGKDATKYKVDVAAKAAIVERVSDTRIDIRPVKAETVIRIPGKSKIGGTNYSIEEIRSDMSLAMKVEDAFSASESFSEIPEGTTKS